MEAKHLHLGVLGASLILSATGCIPDLEEADTLIDRPQVLAVRAEPAEIEPRKPGTFTALYVSEDGTLDEAPLSWAFCKARKPLAELGPINPICLLENADDVVVPNEGDDEEEEPEPIFEELGEGIEANGNVPSDACRRFGPDRPPPMDGEPAGRPVDADPTGGYYQPLRVLDADQQDVVLLEARITCGLPGAGQATTRAYNQRFAANDNPVIDALAITSDDDRSLAIAGDDDATRVRPGEALELELRWAQCDALEPCDEDECEPPPPCAGAQAYIYYDPQTRALSARREGMRVSWFATGGTFRDARTGRTEQEADTTRSPNVWTAPEREGEVTLWAVLRDDRGGVTWQTYSITVER